MASEIDRLRDQIVTLVTQRNAARGLLEEAGLILYDIRLRAGLEPYYNAQMDTAREMIDSAVKLLRRKVNG